MQQTAEQLVEVPTIVSFSFLNVFVQQNVDIPVPHGRGGRGGGRGLQGLRPGQVSHSLGDADEAFTDFFALFPKFLKSADGSALGVGTECGL